MDRRIKLRVLSAAKVDPNFSVVDDEIRDYKNHLAYNAETDEYYITGILDGMIGVPECMTGIVGLMGNYRRIDTKALERLMSFVENYKTIATKKVKRWETYNGDFIKAFNDYLDEIHHARHYHEIIERGFAYWLMEEIEVVEE